jgi:hypothetical protein
MKFQIAQNDTVIFETSIKNEIKTAAELLQVLEDIVSLMKCENIKDELEPLPDNIIRFPVPK